VASLAGQARDEGDLRPDVDPALVARLLYGMINSVVEWYRPRGADRSGDLAEVVVAVAFDGLRRRGDQPLPRAWRTGTAVATPELPPMTLNQ
jgi:hypothetical protein